MSKQRRFKVALIQMACAADPEENLHVAISRVQEAAGGKSVV